VDLRAVCLEQRHQHIIQNINVDKTDLVRAMVVLFWGFESVCDGLAKIRARESGG
jgi:hypothetical protein